MNTEQFTATIRKAFGTAQTIALRRNHQRMGDLHLLAALLEEDEQAASRLLMRAGVNMDSLNSALEAGLKKIPEVTGSGADNLQIDPGLGHIVADAESWSKQRGDSFISVDAVLMAMIARNVFANISRNIKVKIGDAQRQLSPQPKSCWC